MADDMEVSANGGQLTGSSTHTQRPESLNPSYDRINDENRSTDVANGDVQLSDGGNQRQQTQEQFPRQPGEQGDGREEFTLETGQDPVLFDNPRGLEVDRETVLSQVGPSFMEEPICTPNATL